MAVQGVYAVICVTDLDRSIVWYRKLLSKDAPMRPMDFLAQWFGNDVNLQLWKHDANAGHSMTTIVFTDIEGERSRLDAVGIELGEITRGHFGGITKLSDPDGNEVTLAEPPKG